MTTGKEVKEFRGKPGYAITGVKVKSDFYIKVTQTSNPSLNPKPDPNNPNIKVCDIKQGKRSLETALNIIDEGLFLIVSRSVCYVLRDAPTCRIETQAQL